MFCYRNIQWFSSWGSILTLKKFLHMFFLEGYDHLWYILAILYTIVLLFLLNRLLKNGLAIAYNASFLLLIIGVLSFNYGNVFLKIPLVNCTIGKLNFETNMPSQWLFVVFPFFMMGYGLRGKQNSWLYNHSEILMLIVMTLFPLEVTLSTIFDLKASTIMCFAIYPIVYLMLLSVFKHDPYAGRYRMAKYCSGIASFMYFGHMIVILILHSMGLFETPVFLSTLLVTGTIGAIIVSLDNPALNCLIR